MLMRGAQDSVNNTNEKIINDIKMVIISPSYFKHVIMTG